MITLALAGKPNCGKSTFFKAATLADVEIANYPFTTIDANHGVAYVRSPCVCRDLGTSCGVCKDGVRFIPIGLIDVAGLVPEAHKGRGLGNQFLDHLRQADAILHILDASGSTDAEGNPVGAG
ncbi:MAG TPA: GTPase, partial [Methanomicrobiales archaeon]|nr:GTPase [Methanomicrobiales archaeon]